MRRFCHRYQTSLPVMALATPAPSHCTCHTVRNRRLEEFQLREGGREGEGGRREGGEREGGRWRDGERREREGERGWEMEGEGGEGEGG